MRIALVCAGLAALLATSPLPAQVDYRRAEQFLTWNTLRHVYHDQVVHSLGREPSAWAPPSWA